LIFDSAGLITGKQYTITVFAMP